MSEDIQYVTDISRKGERIESDQDKMTLVGQEQTEPMDLPKWSCLQKVKVGSVSMGHKAGSCEWKVS